MTPLFRLNTALPYPVYQKNKIYLEGLLFYSYHGCDSEERSLGNKFEVDICLEILMHDSALLEDNLSGTVDYKHISQVIQRVMMAEPKHLLESIAHIMVTTILDTFDKVVGVRLSVTKINPPIGMICRKVKVEIEKKRNESATFC